MATATVTMTETAEQAPSTSTSAASAATLRSLYPRAAHAFLHRDVSLTHSLITSAFALLTPPSVRDDLHELRKKWEILRVTLEVTVYTSPPENLTSIPAPLRSNAMLSGPSFITSLHSRSLALFSPVTASKPDAAFLSASVLVVLAAAGVRVHAPSVSRLIIEDWLAQRGQPTDGLLLHEDNSYEKVIDIYCTSVLPALDEWKYATEFLEFEDQLDSSSKERIAMTLRSLYSEYLAVKASADQLPSSSSSSLNGSATSSPTPTSSRPISPSSSSESISTASTHTVVPSTPKGRTIDSLTPVSPIPQKSSKSATSAATSRTVTPLSSARRTVPPFRTPSSNGHAAPSNSSAQVAAVTPTSRVSALTLVHVFIRTHLERGFSLSQLAAVILVFAIPIVSIVFRLRRRRSLPPASSASSAVADVRRRLGAQKQASVWQTLWQEAVRAIGDTVRMGGRGLV